MSSKSVLDESRQIGLALQLIALGARLQVLESEVGLSYERLSRLYREVVGKSPPKGQLPFSTDWFLTWQPNVHASLFMNVHGYLSDASDLKPVEILIKSYRLYTEQVTCLEIDPMLSLTRAWRLTKFVKANMLVMTKCKCCQGAFVTDTYENARHFVCGLCQPPARAGRGSNQRSLRLH